MSSKVPRVKSGDHELISNTPSPVNSSWSVFQLVGDLRLGMLRAGSTEADINLHGLSMFQQKSVTDSVETLRYVRLKNSWKHVFLIADIDKRAHEAFARGTTAMRSITSQSHSVASSVRIDGTIGKVESCRYSPPKPPCTNANTCEKGLPTSTRRKSEISRSRAQRVRCELPWSSPSLGRTQEHNPTSGDTADRWPSVMMSLKVRFVSPPPPKYSRWTAMMRIT
ncbi:hypothetical protein GGR51DRAFT_563042 [Nemania sp. FL0031]|nr:hypothetical protein GGR51DRAFT_563042 [Nemania sp. FL0031]